MSNLTDRLFGTHSQNELKKLNALTKKVLSGKEKVSALSGQELAAKTEEFRSRLQKGESLDDLLPEAFAVMREADRRTLSMEPFPVQITGGILLHQGRVAELKTGEGKTLTATLPVYLNALSGENVCVVTVNDYLAARDAEEMRPAYEFMGLSVGVVTNSMEKEERKRAYACDVTYVTNSELGFDYLRDNLAKSLEDQVLRGLSYALIDEADSVLIDEARTPLIISGQEDQAEELFLASDVFVRTLVRGSDMKDYTKLDILTGEVDEEDGDFSVDEKDKAVSLTEAGIRKAEQYFHVENLMEPEQFALLHRIQNALRAHSLMRRDRDYIVKDGEVLIVDEFTGRVLPGRRFSDGLHQALEAKEGVSVNPENTTLASITYQSFFNHFKKKSGMTGTGVTAETEFREVYGMDVVAVPTNRPVVRTDLEDLVFRTKEEKEEAIIKEVLAAVNIGQPVLIGTQTIRESEMLSEKLDTYCIPHTVLNAKQDKAEAEIVASAGQYKAVTIATNMAGRGTDIKLSDASREAGGLYVIGTGRSESRRIDDQLIGRSGRQGDPGKSRFFLSLEDDLFTLFASRQQLETLKKLAGAAVEPLVSPLLTKAVRGAQSNMEATHAAQRMHVLKYDEVLAGQRDAVYEERERVLREGEVSDQITTSLRIIPDWLVKDCWKDENPEESKKELLLECSFLPKLPDVSDLSETMEDCIRRMQKEAFVQYEALQAQFPEADVKRLEKWALLTSVDEGWSRHLDDLELLKQGSGLQSYGGKDPLAVYRMESVRLYKQMVLEIQKRTLIRLFGTLKNWQQKKREAKRVPAHVRVVVLGDTATNIRIEGV